MKPTTNEINDALRDIERAERPANHPRTLAREAIAQWRSNAQREGLPVTNLRDKKGAELLDVDRVVRGSYPTYSTVMTKRSIWSKLFGRRG